MSRHVTARYLAQHFGIGKVVRAVPGAVQHAQRSKSRWERQARYATMCKVMITVIRLLFNVT